VREPVTIAERQAWSAPGAGVLVSGVAAVLAGAALLIPGVRQCGGAGRTGLIAAAVLVSSLLVVWCSEQATQQAVNAGSRYQ
jgi:uncharacterized membrane protein